MYVAADCFYIALFSALEQTHCTLVACDSRWMTVAFYSTFELSTQVVYLQCYLVFHGWCHVKLLLPQQVLCSPYSVISCKTRHACLAVSVTSHLHFWQNDRGLLQATVITRVWNRYQIRVCTETWPWRRKFSHCSCQCQDSNPPTHLCSLLVMFSNK